MTAPADARRLSPYCQMYTDEDEPDATLDEIHSYCKGPGEVRLEPVPPATCGLHTSSPSDVTAPVIRPHPSRC